MTGDLRRLIVLARPWWPRMALGVGLQWATVVASVGLMATSAWLISTAGLHPSIAVVQVAVVGVRFFGISRGVLRYLERLVMHDATLGFLATLRVDLFRRLIPLAPARLSAERSGEVLSRFVGDVETLDQVYLRVVGPAASGLVVATTTVALLTGFGASLAGAALAGLALAGVVAPWVAWHFGARHGAAVVRHRTTVEGFTADCIQGLAELTAFGRTGHVLDELRAANAQTSRVEAAAARGGAFGGALVGAAADLTTIVVLVVAVPLVAGGSLQGVNLAVVVLAAVASFEAVAILPAAMPQWAASREAARRVFALIDEPPPVPMPAAPEPLPPGSGLVVEGLRFSYEPEGPPVLADVSFELASGRLVAVVGPSGAGKSTIAALLLRFWDVPEATTWLGGVDVTRLDPDEVRARFAFAGQRADLLTGTLAENLRMGRPDASEDDLIAVLTRVGLGTWLVDQPGRLQTWVGAQGRALSGGERHRVALARALLSTAPILLLDEPTAHVDAVTAQAVFAEIRREATARSALVITHRLVGLEAADEIVVLEQGRQVERGRFDDLVAAHGTFRRLFDHQRGGHGVRHGVRS